MVISSISTNVTGLDIIRQLNKTDSRIQTNMLRLSTGLRINGPADDPGGFVTSNKYKSQYLGLNRASENTQEAITMVNTASSAVSQIVDLLTGIRTAAVAASGGSVVQQAAITQKIDEINRIANTTKFGNKYLLNGALTSTVDFKSGTRDFGASLSFGPNATTLFDGRSYLNMGVTNNGSAQINYGADAVFNTGISILTDIAVTTAQFIRSGSVANAADPLISLTANRVSLKATDIINFSGLLADGATFFSGSLSVAGSTTLQNLVTTIQSSIDAKEKDLGINGTGVLETTAGIGSNGRLQFYSGTAKNISQFDIDFTVKNAANTTKTTFSVDHSATIYNPVVGSTASGAKIGNNVTAITGSTFATGAFSISVTNVVAAQRRQITTNAGFYQNAAGTIPVLSTTAINNSFFNGVSIATGGTLQINGANPDGSTFTTNITVGTDTGVGDGIAQTYGDLILELNNRDQSLTSYGFNNAISTLTAGGNIRLYDDVQNTSSTGLQIVVNTVSGPQVLNSTVNQAGARESATLSIAGGASQNVTAGQVVTLQGTNLSGGPKPEMTFRVGSGFIAGADRLDTTAKQYKGTLNGGAEVTFQNGDKAVTFTSGEQSIYPIDRFQQVTLDFDSIIGVTSLNSKGGETFVLSASSNKVNYQLGMDENGAKSFIFANLLSSNLGTDASKTLDTVNVTTASGATAALSIIDNALDQVNEFGGKIGAFSSRLESTSSALDAASMDIQTAYAKIVSADTAKEATELTTNSLLLQAGSAVLVQATSLPQTIVKMLLDINN